MRTRSGFTLVEMMVTVAIIGILAAIGIPTFQKYLYTSRASEGPIMMGELYRGQASTYSQRITDAQDNTGDTSEYECYGPYEDGATVGEVPRVPNEHKFAWNWALAPGCKKIGFAPADPLYFSYVSIPLGNDDDDSPFALMRYINLAFQDVDGNGKLSAIIELIGVNKDHELYRAKKTEFHDSDLDMMTIYLSAVGQQ